MPRPPRWPTAATCTAPIAPPRRRCSIVKPEGHSINIKGDSTCAVVFAVEPTDYEYGQLGLVITSFGWASMSELARGDPGRLKALQAAANEAPNVNLFPDGALDPV